MTSLLKKASVRSFKSGIFSSVFSSDDGDPEPEEHEEDGEGLIDTILGEGADDESGVTLPDIGAKRNSMYEEMSKAKLQQNVDTTKLLLTQKMFYGEDPLKNLSSVWLAGGAKGEMEAAEDEDEEEYDEEDYANLPDDRKEELQAKAQEKLEKEQYAEDERRRIRLLANNAAGHVTWMRGHPMRSDLIPAWQVPRRNMLKDENAERMYRLSPGKHWLNASNDEIWYKAYMPASGKVWCWSEQIVNEVRFHAESSDMPLAWITVKAAQRAYRKNPNFKLVVQRHVVAVNNEGHRFLWSQAFAQMLEVFHRQQGFVEGDVRCTLQELRQIQPSVKFPVPGIYPSEKKPAAMTLPVPKAFPKSRLLNAGDRGPVPPPLPERLSCKIPYVLDPEQPWSGILATKEQKEELEFQMQQLRNMSMDATESEIETEQESEEAESELWEGSNNPSERSQGSGGGKR